MDNGVKLRVENGLGWLTAYCSIESGRQINLLVYLRSKDEEARDNGKPNAESNNSQEVHRCVNAALKELDAIAAISSEISSEDKSFSYSLTFTMWEELERCLRNGGLKATSI